MSGTAIELGARAARRAGARSRAAGRVLHRHERLHRLQGLRGRLQGVERGARSRTSGFSGDSYDNSGDLGANRWRHVAFIEQRVEVGGVSSAAPDSWVEEARGRSSSSQGLETHADDDGFRWLMSSDVCKHCTEAGCLDGCPTGSIFRTEFGTVVVQEDICNGCGYCVTACPYGVLDRRSDDGRVWKCTLCYDRLQDDMEPACAQACPTDSIQFGRAGGAAPSGPTDGSSTCTSAGSARPGSTAPATMTASAAIGAFFLLLDEPETYGLPPDPVVPTRQLGEAFAGRGGRPRRALLGAGVLAAFVGRAGVSEGRAGVAAAGRSADGRRRSGRAATTAAGRQARRSGPGRSPGTSSPAGWPGLLDAPLAWAASASGNSRSRGVPGCVALAAISASPALLVSDLGRPERFLNMLRVFKLTSPMSVGSWILLAERRADRAGRRSRRCSAVPAACRSRAPSRSPPALGLPLATYTGGAGRQQRDPGLERGAPRAAVPVRRQLGRQRRRGAASLLTPAAAAGPARRLAIAGAVGELIAAVRGDGAAARRAGRAVREGKPRLVRSRPRRR